MVLFGQTEFDSVEMLGPDGNPKPAMANIPQASKDCEDMKQFMLKFGALPENIFLLDNPSEKETRALYMKILKKLVAGRKAVPVENFLVLHVFAGHGV